MIPLISTSGLRRSLPSWSFIAENIARFAFNTFQKIKQNGMEVVAISMDGKEKALETAEKASASFPIVHGLTIEMAREWGLYLSSAIPGSPESDVFSEAGLFVIRPDHTVFMAQVQSAPFTRPNIEQLVGGLKFAGDNGYPARGTFA
jgi:peroxiredoxin